MAVLQSHASTLLKKNKGQAVGTGKEVATRSTPPQKDVKVYPKYRALHAYEARMEGELSFKQGDKLYVTSPDLQDTRPGAPICNKAWWEAELAADRSKRSVPLLGAHCT